MAEKVMTNKIRIPFQGHTNLTNVGTLVIMQNIQISLDDQKQVDSQPASQPEHASLTLKESWPVKLYLQLIFK